MANDKPFAFNCILWGESGTGKSPIAATLAGCEQTAPCLLLDVDKGAMSIIEEPRPTIFRITSWSQAEKIYGLLKAQKWEELAKYVECDKVLEYKSVVIDSGTELEIVCRRAVQAETGSEVPEQRDYLKTQEKLKPLYRKFRDLPSMSIVMTAGVRDLREDISGIVKYYPAFTPGLVHDLVRMTDLVMYLDVKEEDKKWTRVLQTTVSKRIIARSRSPKVQALYKGSKLYFKDIVADMLKEETAK